MRSLIVTIYITAMLAVPAWGGDAYFVSKNGNNNWSGTSWDSAWATPGKADSTLTNPGDTVVFGEGVWYNCYIRPPRGGTPTTWTIYACSSYYEYLIGNYTAQQAIDGSRKADGTYRTFLTSAKKITDWVPKGTNSQGQTIWAGAFTEDHEMTGWGLLPHAATLSQGWGVDKADSQFVLVSMDSNRNDLLNSGGKYWRNADSVYMVPFGDNAVDPNNAIYTFMASGIATVAYNARGSGRTAYVRIWGLEIKHGLQGVILYLDTSVPSCSTFVEHSHLAMAGQDVTENPGVIMARDNRSDDTWAYNKFIVVRACSLGWALPVEGIHSLTQGNKGGAVVMYAAQNTYVDSCYIYGKVRAGVHFKNDDYDAQSTVAWYGNVVRYTTIMNAVGVGVAIDVKREDDSIYGNIISGAGLANGTYQGIRLDFGNSTGGPDSLWEGRLFIANNTFYKCRTGAFDFSKGSANRGCAGCGYGNTWKNNLVMDYWSDEGSSMWGGKWSECSVVDTTFAGRVDHNIWWNTEPGFPTFRIWARGGTHDWTYWQESLGFDPNGEVKDPGFVNAAGGDFSRPFAVDEIDDFYAQNRWTVIGAVQPDDDDTVGSFNEVSTGVVTCSTAWVRWETSFYTRSIVRYYPGLSTIDDRVETTLTPALRKRDSILVRNLGDVGFYFFDVVSYPITVPTMTSPPGQFTPDCVSPNQPQSLNAEVK